MFILCINTSYFDELVSFFNTLEFDIKKSQPSQLCPLFNLFLADERYSDKKLQMICDKLNQTDITSSVYGGEIYTFTFRDICKVAICGD